MTSTPIRPARGGVAGSLRPLLEGLFGGDPPVRIRAWDGTETGPADAPAVVLRSPAALRRLLWSPGELGLARAYVTGDLDVAGDLAEGLRRVKAARPRRPSAALLARAARALPALGALGPRPPVPATEARLPGRPSSRRRARAAISHHYDLSNEFYGLVLDPSMAYSCAYWTGADMTLAAAQRAKLDLVCRKLGLRPGMRLLDVGCGWGSLVTHAAREYGVRAVGVTLSRRQAEFARARARAAGLDVEIRLRDYRDVADDPYDAIASIEMGEHVGRDGYPGYAAALHRLVRPGGRVLVQQMSRGATAPGGGAFIERYIAPDMHMRPVGETVALIERSGLEVRDVHALREHYVRTVGAWRAAFEAGWDEAVALVGEETARVWRLYLVGGGLAFEQGRMGVDQILAVRRDAAGRTGLPAVLAAVR